MRGLFSGFQIRQQISSAEKLILGVLPIVIIIALWHSLTFGEAEARVVSPVILPSPYEVLLSFHSLWFNAQLSRSILYSFLRVLGGFFVSVLLAFPLGLLMGAFTRVKALFEPLMVFGAYLPIPALVPLTMSIFGTEEGQKVMFLALAFLIYLLPLILKAVDSVDSVYLQTAYTLGATKWQIVRHVLLGIAAPQIFHALRLGFGVGWTYIILVEMVAANRGLGSIIIVAQRRGPREHIYLVLLVIVALAYLTDRLWQKLGQYLFAYQGKRND